MNPELATNSYSFVTNSDSFFKQIYEQSPLGIVIQQSEHQIICNQAFCDMIGYSQEELLQLSFLDITHPEDRDIHKEYDLLIKKNQIQSYQLEKRYLHKNGDIIHATVTVSSIVEKDGQVKTRIATIADITDKKLTEASLAQKDIELEKYIDSNSNLENFAYFASHDLREPLRTVKNFTQLLRRRFDEQLSGEALEYLQFITEGVEHMDNLVHNLLAFSRVNTSSTPFENIPTQEFLNTVLKNLDAAIRSKNVEISFGQLPESIMGHRSQLDQLFQNLISNAIKFGRPDVPNQISIESKELEDHWQFSIADQGIGIEKEYFEKVFRIFKKLHGKNTEYGKGTGIGLALCKKIVERHGGQIELESEYGSGTTFFFTLAKTQPEATEES